MIVTMDAATGLFAYYWIVHLQGYAHGVRDGCRRTGEAPQQLRGHMSHVR